MMIIRKGINPKSPPEKNIKVNTNATIHQLRRPTTFMTRVVSSISNLPRIIGVYVMSFNSKNFSLKAKLLGEIYLNTSVDVRLFLKASFSTVSSIDVLEVPPCGYFLEYMGMPHWKYPECHRAEKMHSIMAIKTNVNINDSI